jgi:hypothetical protein
VPFARHIGGEHADLTDRMFVAGGGGSSQAMR